MRSPPIQIHWFEDQNEGTNSDHDGMVQPDKIKYRLMISSMIGILFNIVIGTISHFTFEWFGCWPPHAAVMPMNESIWEHLNMNYWPLMWYSIMEYVFIRQETNFALVSKVVNITTSIVFSLGVFYIYKALWNDEHNVIVDVVTFYSSIVIGQGVGYIVFLTSGKPHIMLNVFSMLMLIVYGALFIAFTYYPPDYDIFKDTNTGRAGIQCEPRV